MTHWSESHWSVISDEHLYEILEYTKKRNIKPIFIPATQSSFGEERIIYSRAAARFQHLMILEK
jgi:hypothetical protein